MDVDADDADDADDEEEEARIDRIHGRTESQRRPCRWCDVRTRRGIMMVVVT